MIVVWLVDQKVHLSQMKIILKEIMCILYIKGKTLFGQFLVRESYIVYFMYITDVHIIFILIP